MRAASWAAAALLALLCAAPVAAPQTTTCTKADFEAVVKEGGAALRELNGKNTPLFQAKLRALTAKRKWTKEQYLNEAEPLVRDETIAAFDKKSQELVARITGTGGAEGPAAADCARLGDLKADLKSLLDAQQAKWTYMFAKIEKELAK
jgi:hypothetical protein